MQSALKDAELELKRKESINDYIRYLEDKALMEENQAILDASKESGSDQIHKLNQYAYTKKQLDDEYLKESRMRLEKKRTEWNALSGRLESLSHVCEEGKIALAVAKSHKEHYDREYNERMEEIRAVRQEISILVLSDLKDLQQTLCNEEAELREKKETAEQSYIADIRELGEKEKQLYVEQESLRHEEEKLSQAARNHEEYLKNHDRLKKMVQIYAVKDTGMLYEAIKERAFRQKIAIAEKENEILKLDRHLEQVREGRILEESKAVTKVKDYLESRHGELALSGVDYLSALPKVNREELLERFPLLPYGVVTNQFEEIKEDERIGTIDLENHAVPIYDKKVLESPYVPKTEEGVLLIAKNKQSFLEEDALAMEATRLEKKRSELAEELERLQEMEATYDEDLDYTAKLTDAAFLNSENEMQAGKETVLEHQRIIQNLQAEMERLTAHSEKQKTQMREAEETLLANRQEQVKLAGVGAKSDLADAAKEKLDYYTAEVSRLETDIAKAESEKESLDLQNQELEAQVRYLEEQIRDRLEDWETIYKEYYVEGNFVKADIKEDQLKAEFLAAKAVAEQATIVLEDKKKLITTLKESMSRGLKSIEKRGISVETLEQLRQEGELHPLQDELLNRMSMHLSQLAVQADQLKDAYKKKEKNATRLEGRIEQAISALTDRFGSYEPVEVTKEEAAQALAESDRILQSLEEERKQFEQDYRKYVKNNGVMIDLYKDIKRIVESEELDISGATVLVKEQEEIRAIFEESLLGYDKSNKALARARQELLNYKTQTANVFYTMGAFELSTSVKDDVEVPETYEEAKALLANIREMISYISLEKERVEQGIEDMEAVKNHFENQCIERCKDVRTELDKLPKLSRIQLDGEMIQMVDLTIPYVKEEFIKQRMSDYIDEVVKGADQFQDNNDRIKYMKNRLLLKKLFSVMVTDMNAIRLKLYKRERMKEQSRYLRYEEAVGSTGQSQGIYIQFLVSIINYIAGMYAPEAEAGDLKKVIFIDNPFGAAKDIYIWEPIFALLGTNNVQLIVPARGATPAITNRFDVNYVLGQQLIGGRQQTVVVDYRSQVEQSEVEYENLEYSQGTFDFI